VPRAIDKLLSEVATLAKDLHNPATSGIYNNPERVRAIKLLDECERDLHARGVLSKRRDSVISYPWTVVPGDDTPAAAAAAEFARKNLEKLNFDLITLNLLDAIIRGYAVGEVLWRRTKSGMVEIADVVPRRSDRFRFDAGLNLKLLTPDEPSQGVALPSRKFIVHTVGGKDNNPYGSGLGSVLLWAIRLKRDCFIKHAELGERLAKGSVTATTASSDEKEVAKALEAARQLYQNGLAAVSDAITLKLMEPSSATGDYYIKMIELLNAEMSKCVLGETTTTETSPYQSGGLVSTVQSSIRLRQTKSDSDMVMRQPSKVLEWMTWLNFGPDVAPPTVWRTVGDVDKFLQDIQKDHYVAALGFSPDEKYVQEKYGDHWKAAPEKRSTPPGIQGAIGA
jgi:phage gp29-like protein